MPDPSEILTVAQVCAWLQITKSTLYGLTRERRRARTGNVLPHIKLGKRLTFRRDSVAEWLTSQEVR